MDTTQTTSSNWNVKYFAVLTVLALIWTGIYSTISDTSHWLVGQGFGLDTKAHLGASLQFFIYDVVKILLLLVALIYVLAFVRAALNVDRVRVYLAGKGRGVGYFLASMFGSITPFCSCSSIPLFLGFTMSRIPMGITMSFLITSPLINEIAVVLLWSLLGWKFTLIYVSVGMLAGIIGGFFMDSIKAERWLQPFMKDAMKQAESQELANAASHSPEEKWTVRQRHDFAFNETYAIFKRVWKWVIIGVGIGAILHGYVPENWFAENLGSGKWWTVPSAVLVGIPLYSSVTGIIPIMESLLLKGLPVGTTMAFCMSAVAASIPEFMLLRQVMTAKLQGVFMAYLWIIFTIVGFLFNFLSPYIIVNM